MQIRIEPLNKIAVEKARAKLAKERLKKISAACYVNMVLTEHFQKKPC